MHNWRVFLLFVLSSKNIPSTNVLTIVQQCTEGSTTETPKQEALCTCKLTNNKLICCTDVAITNMTWAANESVSCDQKVLKDPEFVLRCFDHCYETEVAKMIRTISMKLHN